jgi:hypothetical protein
LRRRGESRNDVRAAARFWLPSKSLQGRGRADPNPDDRMLQGRSNKGDSGMTRLRPALGLIVLYRSVSEESSDDDEEEGVHVAIITKVHNDRCVNLVVFPDGKPIYYRQSVQMEELEGQVDRWFSPELD